MSYTNAQTQQASTGNNEYRGCVLGCEQCNAQIANNLASDNCFDYCKNLQYQNFNPPIEKGIIEPDKACIIGCACDACAPSPSARA